jgi:hypothetical protein
LARRPYHLPDIRIIIIVHGNPPPAGLTPSLRG